MQGGARYQSGGAIQTGKLSHVYLSHYQKEGDC